MIMVDDWNVMVSISIQHLNHPNDANQVQVKMIKHHLHESFQLAAPLISLIRLLHLPIPMKINFILIKLIFMIPIYMPHLTLDLLQPIHLVILQSLQWVQHHQRTHLH